MNTKDILEQLARKEISPEVAKKRLTEALQQETSKPITPVITASLEAAEVYRYVIQVIARMLKFEEKHISIQDTPTNLGIDSIASVRLIEEFEKNLGPLPKTLFFEYPTFQDIAHFLLETYPQQLASFLLKPTQTPKAIPTNRAPVTIPQAVPTTPVTIHKAAAPVIIPKTVPIAPVTIPQATTEMQPRVSIPSPTSVDYKTAIFATPSWQNGPSSETSQDPGAKILIYPSSYANILQKTKLKDQIQETIELPVYTDPNDVLKGFKHIAEIVQRLMKQKTYPKATFLAIVQEDEFWKYSYIHGFLLSLAIERPSFRIKIVRTSSLDHDLSQEWTHPEQVIFYEGADRFYLRPREIQHDQNPEVPLVKEGGVYWITGGGGGLGRIFAQHFIEQKKNITLILSGRKSLSEQQINDWNLPQSPHVQWIYKPCDITSLESIQKTLDFIQNFYGQLNGILHSAGVLRDSFLISKKLDHVDDVFAPKVLGAVYLDQATRAIPLDYFVLFSSESGAFGNIGQTDYSAFNAFMDAFAAHRESLRLQKQRTGKTLAVNWPLWKEGGMSVPPNVEKALFDEAGMIPMTTTLGVKSLSKMLGMPYNQVMIAEGNIEKISQFHHILPLTDKAEPIPYNRPHRENPSSKQDTEDLIAIIGMSCRFPGDVSNPEQYWNLLTDHRDVLIPPPIERWDHSLFYDPNPNQPNAIYFQKGAFLNRSVRSFDAKFFNISRREADEIDPQHRYLLELSWEALEHAGILPSELQGTNMGVFVGIISSEYTSLDRDKYEMSPYFITGSMPHMASGRIGYIYDTHGPAISIDTACSSSLAACHLACQSLRSKECNLALVGGINLMLNPQGLVALCKLHALSQDGRCKPFDTSADGYGRSEGGGFVVLKRLSDAIADKDHVLAVVKGSAMNHDGKSQGLTIPNCEAQIDVIRMALENAKLTPDDVQFIEAHGTGTPAGDPIEIRAINSAYQGRSSQDPLAIGSSKANIGHSEAGAGIASLVKMILCIKHQTIPAHLHLTKPNPALDLKRIPAYFPKTNEKWDAKNKTRTVATNSFGFSGTNVHMLLQEWTSIPLERSSSPLFTSPMYFIPISAKTPMALSQYVKDYISYLSELPESASLEKISYALCLHRSHFKHRVLVTGFSRQELIDKLQAIDREGVELIIPTSIFLRFGDCMLATQEILQLKLLFPSYKNTLETTWQPFAELFMIPVEAALESASPTPAVKHALTICSQRALISLLREIGFTSFTVQGQGLGALTAKEDLPLQVLMMQVMQWESLPDTDLPANDQNANVIDFSACTSLQSCQILLDAAFKAHLNGDTIQWKLLLGNNSYKEIKLPTYPFEKHSHWFPESPSIQTTRAMQIPEHPLKGDTLPCPPPIYQHQFVITEQKLPEIRDTNGLLHVGQIMEMLHAILHSAWDVNPEQVTIHHLTFHRGLLVQQLLTVHGALTSDGSLSLYTFEPATNEWILHVSAHLEQKTISHDDSLDGFDLPTTNILTRAQFETSLKNRGLHLGSSVLLIETVYKHPSHLVATLKSQQIQRGMFDAIAQLFQLFLTQGEATTTLLVDKWEKVLFLHPNAQGPFKCVVIPSSSSDVISGDILLFDAEKRLVFVCEGCYMKKLSLQTMDISAKEQSDLLFKIQNSISIEEKETLLMTFTIEMLQKLLKQPSLEIDPDISLYDIGFDSIIGIDLRNAIHAYLNIEIDMNNLFALPTVRSIASLLVTDALFAPTSSLWLRGNLEDQQTPRLYCFPYGAGGASTYREWQDKISPHYNVISIQLPGREDRIDEEAIGDMQQLLTVLQGQLQLNIPYAFYGHSLGALIAYLLTLQIQAQDLPLPQHLFVGAFSAPVGQKNPWLQKIKARLQEQGIDSFSTTLSSEQASNIMDLFMQGSSREFSVSEVPHLTRLLPLFFADINLVETAPIFENPILQVPLCALGGLADDRVSKSEIEGWSALTANSFKSHLFDGDHFFLRANQNQEELLHIIEET